MLPGLALPDLKTPTVFALQNLPIPAYTAVCKQGWKRA
jgi:hypothetical protein